MSGGEDQGAVKLSGEDHWRLEQGRGRRGEYNIYTYEGREARREGGMGLGRMSFGGQAAWDGSG